MGAGRLSTRKVKPNYGLTEWHGSACLGPSGHIQNKNSLILAGVESHTDSQVLLALVRFSR